MAIKGQKFRSKDQRRAMTIKCGAYKLHGLHVMEIARLENCSESLVRYYISEFDRITKRDLMDKTSDRIALEFLQASVERTKHFWILYQQTDNHKVKATCLNSIREEHELMVKMGQSLGVIHREPDKHEHTIS